ncbi:preprotein translocase subunit SecA [Candidatus Roizmanbacteria bacterium RIFCSPLOWO2_12_FULL_40_12]|uniref:Protein translocase subunit SecA n=1 Tax=Candidatus Roizmanbacteria bacterium RIFCSPLOWO2_01_FULL_40_42 TaxID=1802066 RepID=A0A1F7J4L4_9BACT|nr:MAG: preprotein translocase subunit SecA [Candidatus Roizmanbacteria bacterium RIFCSPHIGHO2_01_FULL_40_98]OGK27323.1 MAG: preprotein translocase subunit SecA [Candidatus Roizmanbacteria bacterium RIFCSPHIGHO2_02_FULL_40_53]OGK30805.1 MAG: preprotein translocase subunit SecA [Candidatus Roizmanbacteria bacterium RIFCSPHIGHO2_12_41_18]OGK36428.1 MAG: preprotein translocase subunit SecA [Candidatus Roizmanbacteria bacterium RIFCSPHIGHO2_12_FULL_40_130]OGK50556.1 MAG: preprotein translocase subu
MFNFFKKLLDLNEKEVTRYQKKVSEINDLEDKARKLKDSDFKRETEKLKKQAQTEGQDLHEILPWAFALVREAARRTLGLRHFDVQLVAGQALFEGKITEQKTGEGKTLSATTALYLHALKGKGAHLVTVNDYLARRDAGWMGGIFHFLGLTTSAMISESSYIYDPSYKDKEASDWRLFHLKPISRKETYEADITYGINSEFGFDYLRDNMANRLTDIAQREYYFAIIDEADSVLIDEARTPHIISAPFEQDVSKYYQYAQIVKQLAAETDYVIDEKARTANLTESGIGKIEAALGVENIYEKDFNTLFHVEAALKAETLFKIDKDYIVRENEVVIVDEFTGRLLQGRRFSEGIHQALEAKENVEIQKESKTLATISLQNYFRKYKVLSGMTGTAATEAEEFNKIYKTDVVVVPTHRNMIRKDESDMIYKTERAKYNAVIEEATENYKKGRPVLIGTTSIEKNELVSRLFKEKNVPHQLLNAKNHEGEAQIIAKAGEKGMITVATNMAGRGVDIILGGMPPNEDETDTKKNKEKIQKEKQAWQKKHDEVVELGGLYVIGTERHESRRIDNQLRGRSGRQGDPGETRFFVSLEDDLMRIFGGEQIAKLMNFFNLPEDQPLTHSMVTKAIEQAQVKVEGYNFDIRKHLVEFDDVLNKQREIIYDLRRKILYSFDGKDNTFQDVVFEIFDEEVNILVNSHMIDEPTTDDIKITNLIVSEAHLIVPVEPPKIKTFITKKDTEGLIEYLSKKIRDEYAQKEKKLGKSVWNEIVQVVFLSTIDTYITEHLTSIADLREGINLRGYAQMDPLVEYKNEAYKMFEKLMGDIKFEITRRIFKVEVQHHHHDEKKELILDKPAVNAFEVSPIPEKPEVHLPTSEEVVAPPVEEIPQEEQTVAGFKLTPPGTKSRKIGRNDPCWCGSGKKYKKCHYPD